MDGMCISSTVASDANLLKDLSEDVNEVSSFNAALMP